MYSPFDKKLDQNTPADSGLKLYGETCKRKEQSQLSNRRFTTQECGLSPVLRGHLPGKGRPMFACLISRFPQYLQTYSTFLVAMMMAPF